MIENKIAKIFLKNGFYYEGKFLSKDEKFIEIVDRKTRQAKMISLDEIRSVEFVGGV